MQIALQTYISSNGTPLVSGTRNLQEGENPTGVRLVNAPGPLGRACRAARVPTAAACARRGPFPLFHPQAHQTKTVMMRTIAATAMAVRRGTAGAVSSGKQW